MSRRRNKKYSKELKLEAVQAYLGGRGSLTDDIHNREIIMKGIDYSYYYETEE